MNTPRNQEFMGFCRLCCGKSEQSHTPEKIMRLLLTFSLAFSKNEMEIDLISTPDFAEPWPPLIQCAMSVADEITFGSIIS